MQGKPDFTQNIFIKHVWMKSFYMFNWLYYMKSVFVSCQYFWDKKVPPDLHRLPPVCVLRFKGIFSPLWRISLISQPPLLLSRFQKHPGLSLHLICMKAISRTCFSSPLLFFSSLLLPFRLSCSLAPSSEVSGSSRNFFKLLISAVSSNHSLSYFRFSPPE